MNSFDFWGQFITVALAHFFAVLSPGPDFAITLRQTLTQARAKALWTSLGIACGISIHVSAALFGVAIFLQAHTVLFTILQLIGVSYLSRIAYLCLKSKPYKTLGLSEHKNTNQDNQEYLEQTNFQAWRLGFLTNLANVKAMVFFLSLFTVVIAQTTPFLWQLSFGIWMIFITGIWFAVLTTLISRPNIRLKILHIAHHIDRITGVILLLICLKIIIGLFD